MDYKIVTDGSCDLPPELCREKQVDVVPFYVSFDSETYQKEIAEIPIRDFYEQMVANPTMFPKFLSICDECKRNNFGECAGCANNGIRFYD